MTVITAGVTPTTPVVQPRLHLPSPRALSPGCPAIFIHSDGVEDRAQAVASLCTDEGIGAVHVVGVRDANKIHRMRRLVELHRQSGGRVEHVLFDAARYSGKNRTSGPADLDPSWVQAQLEAGVSQAMTDSPFVPEDDFDTVWSILSQTKAMGVPAIAVLPMHLSLVRKHSARLLELINKAGVPVAIMLEHAKDPLGVKAAVQGLVQVLSAEPKVLLLRTDSVRDRGGRVGGQCGGDRDLSRPTTHLPAPHDGDPHGPAHLAVRAEGDVVPQDRDSQPGDHPRA